MLESDAISACDLECGIAPRSHAFSRRLMERELILTYDSKDLRRNDAWFLIETKWLDAWMSYVLSDEKDIDATERPGPLRNETLFDYEEYCLRDNLLPTKDYRGVNPQVYALYAELYGTDETKPIVRWKLDIYATPVFIDDVREMLHVPSLKARSLVTEMIENIESNENGLHDLNTRKKEHESWAYRCMCRCEFLIPCLNRFLGGGPTYMKERNTTWYDSFCCCRRERRQKCEVKNIDETSQNIDDTSSDEETRGLLE
ncbi:putative peptidase C19, ubiquitin-specific peptidase, DUSP domain, DUSP-like superfamily [Plasmopara halstedii]